MQPARPSRPTGRLEVIRGCMFSGKTTELIRRVELARSAGASVLVFKPAGDTRSGANAVRTHAGRTLDAIDAAEAAEVVGRCEKAMAGRPAAAAWVVAIDEAHFFGGPLTGACREMLERHSRVIVAGLDRDHRGGPFDPLPALMELADEVVTLHAPCAVCGAPAIHSQRMFESSSRIAVGGAGGYEARCARCFVPGG